VRAGEIELFDPVNMLLASDYPINHLASNYLSLPRVLSQCQGTGSVLWQLFIYTCFTYNGL
jgi:hypothetical protein